MQQQLQFFRQYESTLLESKLKIADITGKGLPAELAWQPFLTLTCELMKTYFKNLKDKAAVIQHIQMVSKYHEEINHA